MTKNRRFNPFLRACALITAWAMAFTLITPPPQAFAKNTFELPVPGTMVTTSDGFVPPMLRGLRVDTRHPFAFDFILDSGNADLDQLEVKEEAGKLIRYFLASLTIPENDLWVNLSPYEGDRIIPAEFGVTEMGRDVLAQDYILKQLTASLMYPEEDLGQEFWDKVYARAQQLYGTTDVAVNTFIKVWIVPDKAVVYEHEDVAYVLESNFKVMLEKDYVAMRNNLRKKELGTDQLEEIDVQELSEVSSEVIRDVVIPEIQKEVNTGENFARLRQIYHSLVLAKWYKERLKSSILNRAYADQKKVNGVDLSDKNAKEKIYRQYLEAFKVGVFDYIREEFDVTTQEIIPRKYFSGGLELRVPLEVTTDAARLADTNAIGRLSWIQGVYRQPRSSPRTVNEFIRRQFRDGETTVGEPLVLPDGTTRKTYYVNGLLTEMGQLGHIGFVEKDDEGRPIAGGQEVVFFDTTFATDATVRGHEALKVQRWTEKRESLGLSPEQMRSWLKDNLDEAMRFLRDVDAEAEQAFPLEALYAAAEAGGQMPTNEQIASTYATADDFRDLNLAAGRWGRFDSRVNGMLPNEPVLRATGEGETFDDILMREMAEERGVSVNDLEADFQRTVAMIEDRLRHSRFIAPEADVSVAAMHDIYNRLVAAYRTKTDQEPGELRVVDANSVNAFVIRNRPDVYFYKGLYETLAEVAQALGRPLTQDIIAFIVAHEMSHTLQHTAYLGLDLKEMYENASPYMIQMIKNAEYDADMQALELMDLAGYSVFGAIDAMSFLEYISRTSQPEEVLSSHPYVSLRKNRLTQIIYDQETTVFTHVKAARLPMPGTGKLVSRDQDFRALTTNSPAELLGLAETADSIEAVDEAISMLMTKRGLDVIKTAASTDRARAAFMQYMYMQAGMAAIEEQTRNLVMGFGDRLKFDSLELAGAVAAFGTASGTDLLREDAMNGIENDVGELIDKVGQSEDSRLARMRSEPTDRDLRSRQLIRTLREAYERQGMKLGAADFTDFLLPRSEVEELMRLFQRDQEVSDEEISAALRNPRRLISAFFYSKAIGQETAKEITVPTTSVKVRLQQRSNDLYVANPRFRSTESEDDRQALQEILLTQYLLSRGGAAIGTPNNFQWRRFGGLERLLDATDEEREQMFEAYVRVFSRDFPIDIAVDMAGDRVTFYTGQRIVAADYYQNALQAPGSLAHLAEAVENARRLELGPEEIAAIVDDHAATQYLRRAWRENPEQLRDVDLEQLLETVKAEGMTRGGTTFNALSAVFSEMRALYQAQPFRTAAASEIFQRETRLNFRNIANTVGDFNTLQQLPDWAVADYLAREEFSVQNMIQNALNQGTPVSEIFDFMSSRLSYGDRQNVFYRIFLGSSGVTDQTQLLLDYFAAEKGNDSRDIVLWFLGMFSQKDALANLVALAGKSLPAKAAETADAGTASALKNIAVGILEYAYTQTSKTFRPDAASVAVYLNLIRERIDARGGTDVERREAVHAALLKLSPAVALELKISASRRVEEGAPADYRAEATSRQPEFGENQSVASLPSSLALHTFGWNVAESEGPQLFVTELVDMSAGQLQDLLSQRVRYLATQANVEYREEQFMINGAEDGFSNLLAAILFKKLANPQWDRTGTPVERLDEIMRTSVSYVVSSEDGSVRISNTDLSLRFDQQAINTLPFDTVRENLVGRLIPSAALDKVWQNYVEANGLQARFPEFQALLQNPNAGIDRSNPLGDYLRRTRFGQKVSYRQVLKTFFLRSSAFSQLFNAYIKSEGSGYVYGDYRSLDERLAWMADVLPGKSIIKDGILDLWETDIFPEIVDGLDILAQAAQRAGQGDGDLWTLLGEMDDDVGRLQRLSSELSVPAERINGLLDFYTTIIPQVFSPQKIARYGATAYLLWRQLPDSAGLGLEAQLEALTKFMPEPSILRDELLTSVAGRYITRLEQADDVSQLLYVNNLLARNRDLRNEDFVSETLQHLFGGAKTADKRDVLLWVVGVQEKPPFVTETEDRYRIDLTTLPEDVQLLPASIRNRFIEGFMLGDNGVLDPRTEADREVMRDLLDQLFQTVFPVGVEGITEPGRVMVGRVFKVVMEAYPAYKRVQVIKALADLGFRDDFTFTSLGERLAVLLGVMGPVWIKVAQFLSENDTLVPDASLRSSLGSLRNQAPEVSKIATVSVLKNELPFADRVVNSITTTAGSASIKQVNRGRWNDIEAVAGALTFQVGAQEAAEIQERLDRFQEGNLSFERFAGYVIAKADEHGFDIGEMARAAVYKIVRPNMDATLGSDYDALDAVAVDLEGETIRGESISSVDEMVETVKEWVDLEQDLRNEAGFHRLITDLDTDWAETFAEAAEVTIAHPKIFFASRRLIVEEEIPGVPLSSLGEQHNPVTLEDVLKAGYSMPAAQQVFEQLREVSPRRANIVLSLKKAGYADDELADLADELEKYDYDKIRGLLRQLLLRQILVDGRFHADLHQGNVLFAPDGRLAMIDRGNVGRLNPRQIEGVKTLLKGLSLRQSDVIKRGIDQIFLNTQHADGQTATFANITQDTIQDILDQGYDLKMTMSVIGSRTLEGASRTRAEQEFSTFMKAFTQAIWLFPTDFNNGVDTLQALADYIGMTQEEASAAAQEQAKYFVAADTTTLDQTQSTELIAISREILSEKLATTRNPFTRLMLRGFVFPLIRRSLRRAEANPRALTETFVNLIRSMGPRFVRENMETLVDLRNFEIIDALGELLQVPLAENAASMYLETSLRGRGFGRRSVGMAMPILRGLIKAGRPVTQAYVDILKEWLDRGGNRTIARLAPRMTVGTAIRRLSQAFPQDYGDVKEEFDQLAVTNPPRPTPAQQRIRAAEETPDITPTRDTTDTTAESGLIANVAVAGDRSVLPGQEEVGGIDLNPNLLELQIEGDRLELNIPVDTDSLEPVRIEGLLPVIINVTPITNLPLILGAVEKEPELYAAAKPQ
ncbi:MAG: hypothetical protein KC900_14630 [Candidatus Omnitrophica bacterium]|nr:hypothetical protein [Candidatus Omnitrophota bacterium]